MTNKQDLLDAIAAADAILDKRRFNKIEQYFPKEGLCSRYAYPKQMELVKASKNHRFLAMIGGNGTGKSLFNAMFTYLHASGRYTDWWKEFDGYEWKHPINIWCCGMDAKSLRDGIQELLFGGIGDDDIGTGIIRREDLLDDDGKLQVWSLPPTSNCVGQCLIRHYTNGIFDGYSKIEFKTYEQGWKHFQGPTRQLITFDEEPDDVKIYAECITRLRPRDGQEPGQFLATFTPTDGYTNTYLAFVPQGVFPPNGEHDDNPTKYTVQVTDLDVPHITDEVRAAQIAEWMKSDPNNIEARRSGIAAMGSGRVFPINEDFVVVEDKPVESFWLKAYGMDPGYANFAGIWIAKDPYKNVYYVYDEYQNGKVNYVIHADAFKARGSYLTGAIDRNEAPKPRDTGETVLTYFLAQGLNLVPHQGDKIALIAKARSMFENGTLKIMSNCQRLLTQIRTWRYDKNDPNKIAKDQDDHEIDAMLQCLSVFEQIAISTADYEDSLYPKHNLFKFSNDVNDITGY